MYSQMICLPPWHDKASLTSTSHDSRHLELSLGVLILSSVIYLWLQEYLTQPYCTAFNRLNWQKGLPFFIFSRPWRLHQMLLGWITVTMSRFGLLLSTFLHTVCRFRASLRSRRISIFSSSPALHFCFLTLSALWRSKRGGPVMSNME